MNEHGLFSPPTVEEEIQMIADSSKEFFKQPQLSPAKKAEGAKHFINELIILNAAINYLSQNPTQNTPKGF
jgi:hypothetical protein